MKKFTFLIYGVLLAVAAFFIWQHTVRYLNENKILKEVIARLEADSRIAEVLVSKVQFDEETGKKLTTIKFLEFDTEGKPLKARYFTFPGNIIQFQSLVVRFDDMYVRKRDVLRGKSAYLFWKIFSLDGPNTQEFELTKVNEIPGGYKLNEGIDPFEERLWQKFWEYALNPDQAASRGIKNAQIEAPGTLFVPGTLYVLKIEHDGGIRIDARPLPEILRGEYIPKQ